MHGAQDVHERRAAGSRTVRQFPPDARSVRDARAFTRAVLHDEGVGAGAAERAVMIVSELAGNAVSHAGTAYSVGFERVDRRVRGQVADRDRHLPVLRRARPPTHGTGGRGLLIVDTAADRWGTARDRCGKVVWFEIDVEG